MSLLAITARHLQTTIPCVTLTRLFENIRLVNSTWTSNSCMNSIQESILRRLSRCCFDLCRFVCFTSTESAWFQNTSRAFSVRMKASLVAMCCSIETISISETTKSSKGS
ncbi:uncharacterized protein [Blastocystis hominis]|uniref:Uncharacterized protein n=1 Tax=Blastocystis hominis TaxID=12968 RepID=D8M5J8_BLAHO|nr:uncharacterized protein [Blastocystis hominis]CBK23337.2 unnamed protein product [Blastocystis hominis]|eukprot:XP_012897385.1 uncharacterized protein [Blastocystis hominis]